jgi:hypothetical protein
MRLITQRRVLHGGNFSRNPIPAASAEASLGILVDQNGSVLKRIDRTGTIPIDNIKQSGAECEIPQLINGVGRSPVSQQSHHPVRRRPEGHHRHISRGQGIAALARGRVDG